jgi:diguanylate cyclase (GGDEF)-like protein/PAS domain S-box-containing protein
MPSWHIVQFFWTVNHFDQPGFNGFSVLTVRLRRNRVAIVKLNHLITRVAELTADPLLIAAAAPDIGSGPKIVYANPAFERQTGFSASEVVGQSPKVLQDPATNGDASRYLDGAFASGDHAVAEFPARRKVGAPFWVEWRLSPVRNGDGMTEYWIAIQHDISRRKQEEQALREREERYALANRGSNDGLWDWDLRTNSIYVSERWKNMLGYSGSEIGDDPQAWLVRVHPADLRMLTAAIDAHLEGASDHFEIEHRVLCKDGSYRWMLTRGITVLGLDGRPCRIAGSQTDVTDRKRVEQQLTHDAFHDGMTGLPNRALFLDRVGQLIALTRRRPGLRFAVLYLDLDRFKTVNDSLGHGAGDRLLLAITQRLKRWLGPADTLSRLGGDEFGILIEDVASEQEAIAFAERLMGSFAAPVIVDRQEIFTSASIGIAMNGPDYERPDSLLRDADLAMHRAKSQGTGQIEVFTKPMHDRAVTLMLLENDLRAAVEREEVVPYYQPIVDLRTGRIAGFEALARWRHPRRGLVGPGDFIPLAEETGLIVPIGTQVLRAACLQMAAWRQRFPSMRRLSISVNVSARQFADPGLIKCVTEILEEAGVDNRQLKLEITESVIMANPESAGTILNQLKEREIRLSIDDFGTGYSSLSYLHKFPIDTLKIDRMFVSAIGTDRHDTALARIISELAHALRMDVVAEGIEHPHQLDHLRALNCEYGQGFLFSAPVPAEDIETLLDSSPHW